MVAPHDESHARRRMNLIKSFCGGPGGSFFKKRPLAAGGFLISLQEKNKHSPQVFFSIHVQWSEITNTKGGNNETKKRCFQVDECNVNGSHRGVK
jgi:hypothetical protein